LNSLAVLQNLTAFRIAASQAELLDGRTLGVLGDIWQFGPSCGQSRGPLTLTLLLASEWIVVAKKNPTLPNII
jgi:hypothetical protein